MTKAPAHAIPFAISTIKLPRDGMPIRFDADEAERQALARQLSIPEVTTLSVDLRATPWRAEGVRVSGRIAAEVVQESVVSLEPVVQRIDEPFEQTFVPEDSRLARIAAPAEQELHIDPEGDDPPETFSGDRIDIGAYIAEAVALALDPYPRKAGESFGALDTDPAPDAGRRSAFDVLAELAAKPGRDDE
ncbi:DUF177 domain-containing protein [Jiella sp. M17.18]|uniref:YceD family protein n=1 Tax=Jiella sp. M17.18 TaxID=3234247 RepID=UPI0034E04306